MKITKIKPKGRRATLIKGGNPLQARVSFGYNEGNWSHPTVEIGTVYTEGGETHFSIRAELRFQQHRATYSSDIPPAHGITKRSGWSRSYGMILSSGVAYPFERQTAVRILRLLDRAHEAMRSQYDKRFRNKPVAAKKRYDALECQLLETIVGLRLVGVEVIVYRG